MAIKEATRWAVGQHVWVVGQAPLRIEAMVVARITPARVYVATEENWRAAMAHARGVGALVDIQKASPDDLFERWLDKEFDRRAHNLANVLAATREDFSRAAEALRMFIAEERLKRKDKPS